MRKLIALLAGTMLLPVAANAATTIDQQGTRVISANSGMLAQDGELIGGASFNGSTDAAPFDTLLGSDSNGPNFSAAWSHVYGALDGVVASASLEIGIHDIDSLAAGNQVALFTLNGIDLTALLNAAVEAKPYESNLYGIFTIVLPNTVYAPLLTGNVNFLLNLQNGRSASTDRPFNAGYLDYSKLTINTRVVDPGPDPIPEPATWAMMISGFGLVGAAMRRRRVSVSFA